MRGGRSTCDHARIAARAIPACAGRTPSPTSSTTPPTSHPRVCGADGNAVPFSVYHGEPSPRVRGGQALQQVGATVTRAIPACAGRTSAASPKPVPPGSHPRVCGADLEPHEIGRGMAEPSPRVRGGREALIWQRVEHRAIPACAGRTGADRCSQSVRKSHPRVCGADAHHPRASVAVRSHPRVCGADKPPTTAPRDNGEPSPRVRGGLTAGKTTTSITRAIPACAGRTCHR